ncbi:MAG: XisH family protein [Coleofasciculaceae cyanobacterium]
MSARDFFHDNVRHALEKAGWTITDDPLHLRYGVADVYIDLAAEKLFAAEREGEKIAVEVKSFLGSSAISEFHTALGQFLNYRIVLEIEEPGRVLYLAVPLNTYNSFLKFEPVNTAIERYQVNLLVYEPSQEVVSQWIK